MQLALPVRRSAGVHCSDRVGNVATCLVWDAWAAGGGLRGFIIGFWVLSLDAWAAGGMRTAGPWQKGRHGTQSWHGIVSLIWQRQQSGIPIYSLCVLETERLRSMK
eukprot:1157222-Pelagomonas_calceolata.AAC.4